MNGDDFERQLRRALRGEAYRVPLTLDARVLHERAASAARSRQIPLLRFALPALAAVLVVTTAIAFAVRSPSPSTPSGAAPGSPSPRCDVSSVARHGEWWTEIGGPGAFFNVDPHGLYAGTDHSWKVIVRFNPDRAPGEYVHMWAERIGTDEPVTALFNSDMDPTDIFRLDQPAPPLPGGWYLFEQSFPEPGCWRLSAAIDDEVVGTAVVDVSAAATSGPMAVTLPAGLYMTSDAIPGEPCFVFASRGSRYDDTARVQAWWWDEGASGDCQTTTSSVVPTTAVLIPREDSLLFMLWIPLISGGEREIRLSLDISGGSVIGTAPSPGQPVFFTRIDEVAPSFAPRP